MSTGHPGAADLRSADHTILVVDDDEEILRVITRILEAAGYEVVACHDPEQVVELARGAQPDLILCDIAMPRLDGYGVLRALQADASTARYPVVFVTARREFTERVRAFRYGAVDFISKPFTREMLVRKVERVIEGLERRAGAARGSGGEAQGLLEDVRREARTGVLTVRDRGHAREAVLVAGEIVGSDNGFAAGAGGAEVEVEFREIDRSREEVVPHEPDSLSGGLSGVPSFAQLPESLREVLIVDDNETFRAYLERLLSGVGLRVVSAVDGREGLQRALEARPWLVVTDTRMPRMDGFDLCRELRRHSLTRHLPIIFLSGWDDYKSRYHAIELGADDYIPKTAPVRELLMRIHLVLTRLARLAARRDAGQMEGGIDAIGAAGLLQMCHLTRLTGTLLVRSASRDVEIRFASGEVVAAVSGEMRGLPAVHELLSWTRGAFDLRPGPVAEDEPLDNFGHLLLEGCRLLDEARGVAPEEGQTE